jgi:hypothetical protein
MNAQNQAAASATSDTSSFNIVVLDRGFVYAGDVTIDGDWCIISDAQNVRRWGTSRGLGELAEKGPQRNTQLDPSGTVKAPLRAVIAMIAISSERAKWTAS